MSDTLRGLLAMIACCCIWGLSPVYYKLLTGIPPLEVLAHRTLWSLVFFGAVLAAQRRLRLLAVLLKPGRPALLVCLAAVMISTNWFLFIHSVQSGRGLEASLGYYIYPLVAVLIGVGLFGERLGRVKLAAILLAMGGVATLILGLGATPWIALALAGSFGAYGAVKKAVSAGPVVSVTAEVLVLAPLALAWLALGVPAGQAAFAAPREIFLLMLSGPLTATPLILFSYASRRLAMATVGVMQYINPTLQFLCATLIFTEPFTPWHGAAFALIWAGLALYSVESLRADRASRRRSRVSSALPASPT